MEFFASKEGRSTSGAHVMDHSYVGGGEFLDEWTGKKEALSPPSCNRAGSSDIDGGTGADPPEERKRKKMSLAGKKADAGGSNKLKKTKATEGDVSGVGARTYGRAKGGHNAGLSGSRKHGARRPKVGVAAWDLGQSADLVEERNTGDSRDGARQFADQAVAWEGMGNDEGRVELFRLTEGGSSYKARVMDHSYVGGGKFLN